MLAFRPEDLPESLLESEAAAAGTGYHEALNRLKRTLIVDAVRASDGNVTRAGERLGLHPNVRPVSGLTTQRGHATISSTRQPTTGGKQCSASSASASDCSW